jgi:YegS/Rv2252/BmrU family lipid kinase
LQQAGLDFDLELTQYPNHAIELSYQAKQSGWPVVVAAGGDGLVNEVANGLMQAAGDGEAGTLGIIPLGTANDLTVGLHLPVDITGACRRLAGGQSRLMDVGQVNDRYFVNNSGMGLEAMVTLAHNRLHRMGGKLRYLMAAMQTIIAAKAWIVRLEWPQSMFDGPLSLVTVGNGCRTGGLFYLTPQAVVDDGLLDFAFVSRLNRWQMVWLLPKTLKGQHLGHPLVICRRTTWLTATAWPPIPLHADGEIIDEKATEIHYRLISHKLRVIA